MIFFAPKLGLYLFAIPLGFIFLFLIYLFWQRVDRIQGIRQKLNSILLLLVVTGLLLGAMYWTVTQEILSIYWYPPIMGVVILLRKPLKKIININIKEKAAYGVESQTERGETVKSKAEKQLADWFFEEDIEYEYEKRIDLGSDGTIDTDFYLPEYDIYIEYWGLASADNEVGEEYRARKQEKIELYNKHGYDLIGVYPHHLYELDHYLPGEIEKIHGVGFWQRLMRLFGFGKAKPEPSENLTKSKTMATDQSRNDDTMTPADTDKEVEDQKDTGSRDPNAESGDIVFCTNCGAEGPLGGYCTECGHEIA